MHRLCRVVSQEKTWVRSVEDETLPMLQQTAHKENRPSNVQDREGYLQTSWTPGKAQIPHGGIHSGPEALLTL